MASSSTQPIPSQPFALASAAYGHLNPMTYAEAREAAGRTTVFHPLKPSIMLDTADRTAMKELANEYKKIGGDKNERVKDLELALTRWLRKSIGARVIFKADLNYADMKKAASSREGAVADEAQLASFPTIPSEERPTIVYDNNDRILVYKYRLHDPDHALLDELTDSTTHLPARKAHSGPRGIYTIRHYGVWADSAPSPYNTADTCHEASADDTKPGSTHWLARNRDLFNRVSDDVRMICPEFHAAHKAPRRILPTHVHPPAGLFQMVVVNQGEPDADTTTTHNDWKDHRKGFNCVLPFGDYEGGELVLWQLRMVLELRPGDVVLFRGHQISHNSKEVTGTRNSIDLFDHDNVFKWAHDVFTAKKKGGSQADATGHGQHELPGPQYW